MATPKWYNMFPHGNYGIFNLDFLLQKYGEQDERIKKVEEKNVEQDTRLDADEADIAQLQDDMSQAKSDIDALEGRMDTAEGDISDLKNRMQTAEGDIDALEGRMDTAEGDIDGLQAAVGDSTTGLVKDVSDLKQDVSDIKQDIIDIGVKDQAQDNDIAGLDSRVDDLEAHSVVANPGGSGANLNSIAIDGVNYLIPSSGGGGSGSTVTPNPAGVQPTDPELSAIGIDALNYRIPVTAADKTAIEGDISDIRSDISDLETAIQNITTNINENIATLESSSSIMANGNVQAIPNTSMQFTAAGTYLVTATLEVNTTNYGSTPRFIGFYFRDDDTNWLLDKFSVFGTEPSTITQAADLALSSIIKVTQANLSETFKLCLRIQSSTNKSVDYDAKLRIVKLNDDPTT